MFRQTIPIGISYFDDIENKWKADDKMDEFTNYLAKVMDRGFFKRINSSDEIFYFWPDLDDNTLIGYYDVSRLSKAYEYSKEEIHGIFDPEVRKKFGYVIKPGKFAKKILGVEVSDDDIHQLSQIWQGNFIRYPPPVILDSSYIRWAYHENNYEKLEGPLGNSCMKYPHLQDAMEFYEEIEAKIAVIKGKHDEEKVAARAIAWELTPEDITHTYGITIEEPITMIDRIYAINPTLEKKLSNWTLKNGFLLRRHDTYFLYKDVSHVHEVQVHISIPAQETERAPYLDTMAFFVREEGVLENKFPEFGSDVIELRRTDGNFVEQVSYVFSDYLQEEIPDHEAVYSEIFDSYLLAHEALEAFVYETQRLTYTAEADLEEHPEQYGQILTERWPLAPVLAFFAQGIDHYLDTKTFLQIHPEFSDLFSHQRFVQTSIYCYVHREIAANVFDIATETEGFLPKEITAPFFNSSGVRCFIQHRYLHNNNLTVVKVKKKVGSNQFGNQYNKFVINDEDAIEIIAKATDGINDTFSIPKEIEHLENVNTDPFYAHIENYDEIYEEIKNHEVTATT